MDSLIKFERIFYLDRIFRYLLWEIFIQENFLRKNFSTIFYNPPNK